MSSLDMASSTRLLLIVASMRPKISLHEGASQWRKEKAVRINLRLENGAGADFCKLCDQGISTYGVHAAQEHASPFESLEEVRDILSGIEIVFVLASFKHISKDLHHTGLESSNRMPCCEKIELDVREKRITSVNSTVFTRAGVIGVSLSVHPFNEVHQGFFGQTLYGVGTNVFFLETFNRNVIHLFALVFKHSKVDVEYFVRISRTYLYKF